MAGRGEMTAGQVTIGSQAWHPTVLYLLALIIAEMVVFGWVSHLLR